MNFVKNIFNKSFIVFLTVILISAVGSFGIETAEAKGVNYKLTNISLRNGKCTFYGYFYNSTGATVTRIKFFGTITAATKKFT